MPLRAFEPVALGGESMLAADWAGTAVVRDSGPRDWGQAAFSIESVKDAQTERFSQVVRATTSKRYPDYWLAEIALPTERAIAKGDTLWMRLWFRTISAENEQREAELCVYFQQKDSPWGKSVVHRVSVGPEWTQLELPFTTQHNQPAGEATLNLGLGFRPQVIEIAGVELWRFPKTVPLAQLPRTRYTYEGRAADAAWRAQAIERIKKIRTTPLVVEVRGADGKPVPNATVVVNQTRNAFQFGTSVDSAMIMNKTPDAQRYRRALLENFNTAVIENGFKWQRWAPNQPKGRWPRAETIAAFDWLSAQNLRLRGHTLVWPGWKYTPEEFRPPALTDAATLSKAIDQHIVDLMNVTKGKLDSWDVVNEPLHERDYFTLLPETEAMAGWYKLAKKTDPKPRLFLNDYDMLTGGTSRETVQSILEKVAALRAAGAPVEGLGVQGHFGQAILGPERILADLDLLASAGLPVLITEFDINTPDEEVLGDFTRDFLLACYSHPAVAGVITWGFWEKNHWLPQAAMFRPDWSERPNAAAWRSLVNEAWNSRSTGKTDASGSFTSTVHHGDYEVSVRADKRATTTPSKVTVSASAAKVIITLP
ncbi:MAG: endo-1,4-beta-xylanase [Opitutus sp.]|nr:endo-1,4-beta-xylanase [Opitutus sp.]MCS6246570.1 endo-1,4-beta-xylanase [Opitutus sp.]MCS6272745.1 endo-1,4-beta-xylanase [Opitutus sp.]MCS6276377.1 endo-1,4-beta-xylanase [Opitutus sp.]MCS6301975.1 endo-1,4-beta-xylanase [Opitutus sp.]